MIFCPEIMFYLRCFNQLLAGRDSRLGECRGCYAGRVYMLMTLIILFRKTHCPLRSFQKLKKNRETDISDTTTFTHCSASCSVWQLWLYSAMVGIASDLFMLLVFNNAVLQSHVSSNKTKRKPVLPRKWEQHRIYVDVFFIYICKYINKNKQPVPAALIKHTGESWSLAGTIKE